MSIEALADAPDHASPLSDELRDFYIAFVASMSGVVAALITFSSSSELPSHLMNLMG